MLAMAAALLLSQTLQDHAPPPVRLVHRQTVSARFNPIGLLWDGRLSLRFRLYERDSLALRDNFLSVGLVGGASPTFARIGAQAEVQPASFIGVWALYEGVQYFGTFDHLRSFANAQADFSDSALKSQTAQRYAARGTQLTLGLNLQAKLGPLAARAQLKAVRPDFALKSGDTVEYDITYDLAMPNRGWSALGDVDVLYQRGGFIGGARFSFGVPFYETAQLDASLPPPQNASARVGPFVGYTFRSQDGAAFNQPTVLLLGGWYLTHPYRTGADVSRAVPYVALAFTFNGDLLPSP